MEDLEKKGLTIAICDDEEVSLCYLRQIAEQALGSYWALEILCTDSPEKLLEQADRTQIALLDIQMLEENGIALAQRLLEKNPQCNIIFVSGYVQFVSDVYDVPHLCMVLKDQVDAQLPKYLRRAADAAACGDGHLAIRTNGPGAGCADRIHPLSGAPGGISLTSACKMASRFKPVKSWMICWTGSTIPISAAAM